MMPIYLCRRSALLTYDDIFCDIFSSLETSMNPSAEAIEQCHQCLPPYSAESSNPCQTDHLYSRLPSEETPWTGVPSVASPTESSSLYSSGYAESCASNNSESRLTSSSPRSTSTTDVGQASPLGYGTEDLMIGEFYGSAENDTTTLVVHGDDIIDAMSREEGGGRCRSMTMTD